MTTDSCRSNVQEVLCVRTLTRSRMRIISLVINGSARVIFRDLSHVSNDFLKAAWKSKEGCQNAYLCTAAV